MRSYAVRLLSRAAKIAALTASKETCGCGEIGKRSGLRSRRLRVRVSPSAPSIRKQTAMPTCYQLVGVSGSGKSTWVKNQIWALGLSIVSTDNFVEAYATEQGKTYTEVFTDYMPIAVRLMANHAEICRANGVDVIWDQTSTTVKSRARKFNMLPDYEHIAVVFAMPDRDEHARRLNSRPDKIIPDQVVADMIQNFEMPTLEEGFTEIWRV